MEEALVIDVPKKRPPLITFLCVFSLIGAMLSIPVIISSFSQDIGKLYPSYVAVSSLIGIGCMIGFWKMQKWALYLYIALTVVNQVVLITMGTWHIYSLIIPNLVILVVFKYKNLMK
jgi:hypothetical protein